MTAQDTSVALVWDDEQTGAFTGHPIDPMEVAGHQFNPGLVHVWIDATDGPKIVTLDLTVEDAERLANRLLAEVHAQKEKQS